MNFTENLLASAYNYYSRKKRIDAFFQAKLLLVIILSMFLLLLLLLLNEFFKFHVFNFLSHYKWLAVVFYLLIFFGIFKYYTKDKMSEYIQVFELKSKKQKRLWGLVTILCAILPLVLFFLVLRIQHPV